MKMLNGIDEVQSQVSELVANSGRTSTVIVAPSDATAKSKAIADYVCDGTNDAEVIRNALHEAIGLGDGGEDFCWTHVQSAAVVPWLDFPFFWHDGEKFCAYGSDNAQENILRATSLDGVNWTLDTDNNPMISVGAAGSYDDGHVAVFHPWMEDGTWHALYNSNSGICYATSPDGITWTKYAGNPVIPKTTDPKAEDPAGLIKVDSTYYLYTNSTGRDRQTDVWTSTNLTTWTKSSDIPAFTGGRYCSCPFKVGSVYYLIVSKQYEGRRGSCLELWSSASPLFRPGDRKFLGVVVHGRTWVSVDTPSVINTTIARDEFYNDEFWCYYAREGGGTAAHPGYLVKEDSVADAISKAVLPRMNGEVLLTEGTIILKDESTTTPAITLDFGITLRGLNTIIKPDTGFNSTKEPRGAIAVSPGCLLSGVIIDGNSANTTAVVKMLGISYGGKAENIHIRNCNGDWLVQGDIENARIYNNSVDQFYLRGYASIRNSKIYGNSGTAGMCLIEKSSLIGCEVFDNRLSGVLADGDTVIDNCYFHHNGVCGLKLYGNATAKNCRSEYHSSTSSHGITLNGSANIIDCIVKYNYKGVVVVANADATIKGGVISNNARWGVEVAGVVTMDGTRLYENIGYSNNGQVYLGAVSRIVNCVMDASTTIQKNQIQVVAAATGSVIGNNKLKKGSVGYIELVGGATITEYNNQQVE